MTRAALAILALAILSPLTPAAAQSLQWHDGHYADRDRQRSEDRANDARHGRHYDDDDCDNDD